MSCLLLLPLVVVNVVSLA